jgi:hypothetical protein
MLANDLPIASPCGADWRTMKPSDTKRFCDACKKHVHDLSSMTEAEAQRLMETPPTEGLCVRYLYDARGVIAFRPAPIPASLLVRAKRAAWSAAGVAALALPLTACMGAPAPIPAKPAPSAAASSAPAPMPSETAATPPVSAPKTK